MLLSYTCICQFCMHWELKLCCLDCLQQSMLSLPICYVIQRTSERHKAQAIHQYDNVFRVCQAAIKKHNLKTPPLFECDDIDRTSIIYFNKPEVNLLCVCVSLAQCVVVLMYVCRLLSVCICLLLVRYMGMSFAHSLSPKVSFTQASLMLIVSRFG